MEFGRYGPDSSQKKKRFSRAMFSMENKSTTIELKWLNSLYMYFKFLSTVYCVLSLL